MRKRNYTVTIRMNKAEYDLLQNKVKESGQTQQAVVIHAIAGLKIASAEEVEELKKAESDACRDAQPASWCCYEYQPDCTENECWWIYTKRRYFALSQSEYPQLPEGE